MSVQQTSGVRLTVTQDAEPLLSLRLLGCGPKTVVEISGEVDISTTHLLTELVKHVAQSRPAEVIGSIAQDQIEDTLLCRRSRDPALNGGADGGPGRLEPGQTKVFADRSDGGGAPIDEGRPLGAPRERLDPHRSRPRVQIEAAGAVHQPSETREQALPRHIRQGTGARGHPGQPHPLGAPRDDPHGSRA